MDTETEKNMSLNVLLAAEHFKNGEKALAINAFELARKFFNNAIEKNPSYKEKVAETYRNNLSNLRCERCKGPFHLATGQVFSETRVGCGICVGRFHAWRLREEGWRPPGKKKRKKKRNRHNRYNKRNYLVSL